MTEPKPRRRRWRMIILVVVNCAILAAVGRWALYVRSPDYQKNRAIAAIQRQDWPTAEIHLKNVIGTNPDDAEARLALADAYREMAMQAKPGNPDAARLDPPHAVEQLVEVARLLPKDIPVRRRLFTTLARSGRTEAAMQVAQQLAALGSKDAQVLAFSTAAALDGKKWGEAELLLERLKQIRVETPLADLVLTVRLHEGRGDTEKVDPLLRPMLQELSRKTHFELEGIKGADLATIGFLMRAAVRWAPDGTVATQRFIQSLGILEELARTELGKSRLSNLVEIGAELLAVGKPALPETRAKRQFANEQFYKFAEPVLEANQASPLVYEQLSRAAVDSKDPTRALSILRRGINQHLKLPAERQRELLALHGQAALLLMNQSRFAEAQASLVELLKHPETAPLGNLLAGAVALDEGRFEDAKRHLSLAKSDDGDPTSLEALQVRACLATQQWQPALDVLESLERHSDKRSAANESLLTTMLGGREQLRLLQAQCLAQLGQSKRAEAILQQLERGPLRAQVQQIRVLGALQRGQKREAWDVLRTARSEFPNDQRLVWIEFSLLVDAKAPDGATRLLAGHIRRFPGDLPSRLLMTQWLTERGETVPALEQLAEIRQHFPSQPVGWLLASDLLLSSGRGAGLDELLKEIRSHGEVAHLVPLIQARRNLRMAGLNEADEALRQANPELQRTPAFIVMSAVVSLAQGKAEQALDRFGQGLHFTGVREQVRTGFLQAFEQSLQTANPETLSQRVEELWKQFPDEPAVLLASAEMAMRRSDFETAMQRVNQLAKVDAVPGRPEYMRARVLAAKGQQVEGLAELKRALAKAPQHSASRLFAAQLEFSQGRSAVALSHLDSLVQPAGDEVMPTLLRADVLLKLDRAKDAEKVLIQLTQRQPKLAQAWLALSFLHGSSGQTDAAVKTLEEGLKLADDRRALQTSMIEVLLRSQQTGQAVSASRRFNEGNTDPRLCLHWARLFLSAGQFQAAEDWLKQARKSANTPSDELLFFEALTMQQRATSEHNAGLFQEARDRYGKVLELHPGHVPTMNNLAWLLLRQFDQPAEALAVVEQLRIAVSADRMTPDLLDTVIEVYARSGRQAEFADVAAKSLARFPNSAVLQMQYGAVLIEEAGNDPKRRELARQHLKKVRTESLPPHRQADLTALLARLDPPPSAK